MRCWEWHPVSLNVWPTIYILDADGKIHVKGYGGPEIDKTIVKLLGKMGHDVDLSNDHEDEQKTDEADGA